MGYGEKQVKELSDTIAAVPCDVVLIATPIDLTRVLTIDKPSTRATYELEEHDRNVLPRAIKAAIERRKNEPANGSEVTHGAR
jgi:predicted GTPase